MSPDRTTTNTSSSPISYVVPPQISQPLVPLVDEFAGRLFAELDYVQVRKHSVRVHTGIFQ